MRAVLNEPAIEGGAPGDSKLVAEVVAPLVESAGAAFLRELDTITIEDICQRAEALNLSDGSDTGSDFAI